MPGVRVADGIIIGAYPVVTKDGAPYAIVGGNPAREIRRRFSPGHVERLLQLCWWDWDIEKITRNVYLLTGTDVEALAKCT